VQTIIGTEVMLSIRGYNAKGFTPARSKVLNPGRSVGASLPTCFDLAQKSWGYLLSSVGIATVVMVWLCCLTITLLVIVPLVTLLLAHCLFVQQSAGFNNTLTVVAGCLPLIKKKGRLRGLF
jgi:hypothetical protein